MDTRQKPIKRHKQPDMVRLGLTVFAVLVVPLLPAPIMGASNTAVLSISATVSGVNSLDLTLHNISDDQAVATIQFGSASGIKTAGQYIRIAYNSNALGARVVIRTDNQNSAVPFTGTGEGAGLVGNTDSAIALPLLWAVFPDLASAKSFIFNGDTDPDGTGKGTLPGATPRPAGEAEGLVVDKANPNFESPDVQGFATVVIPNRTNGLLGNFPTDEDGSGPLTGLRSASSPIFLVLGANFFNANSQSYSTSALGLDLVVQ